MELVELKTPSEIAEIYGIYRDCMYAPTEEKFYAKTDAFLEKGVKVVACLRCGRKVGVAAVAVATDNSAEIVGIAVENSERGQGIGSFMVSEIIRVYALSSVYAETDDDAVEFYRKNGFETIGFTEDYGGQSVRRYKCELRG